MEHYDGLDQIKQIEKEMIIMSNDLQSFTGNDYLRDISSETLKYVDDDILSRFLRTNIECFKRYNHKLADIVIIKVISNSPLLIKFIDNPSVTVQQTFINIMQHSNTAIFFINNPTDDILLQYIERIWNESVYECIKDKFVISDYVHKEINRLKIKKGPMTCFNLMK